MESSSAFSNNCETCGVICAMIRPRLKLILPLHAKERQKLPVSFQQLTSTQSPIYPLNPIFHPFIALMMRISFPSNNIT